jgi:hypothetical protein
MSAIKDYLCTQFKEFSALELDEKICLTGSWVAATGAALLIGSSTFTLLSWGNGTEPDGLTKRSMFLGFGLLTGGVMFTAGACKERDRQFDLTSEDVYREMAKRRAQREASICPGCKYFSDEFDLYCALNPLAACTPEANNCKDFEPKEKN